MPYLIFFLVISLSFLSIGLPAEQNNSSFNTQEHSELPNFSNPQNKISEIEKANGRYFFTTIIQNNDLITDITIQDYISELGEYLTNHANLINPEYNFFIINNPSINAFAGPNGYIGVNLGLVQEIKQEGELAAVLSHEIAHAKLEHLQRLSKQKYSSLANPMLILGLAIAGVISANPIPFVGIMGIQGKLIEDTLTYSRKFEHEADREGIRILNNAKFSDQYSIVFMNRLLNKEGSTKKNNPYLITHPLTSQRVADLQNRIENKHLFAPKSEFDLIQARLSVLTGYQPKHITAKQQHYIVAYNILKNHSNNEKQIKELHKIFNKYPNLLLFQLMKIEWLIERKQFNSAKILIDELKLQYANHLVLIALENQLLIQNQQYQQSENLLKSYLNDKVTIRQSTLWELLEKNYSVQKNRVKSLEARAWKFYKKGYLRKSLDLLNSVIRLAKTEGFSTKEINKLIATYNHWYEQLYSKKNLDN